MVEKIFTALFSISMTFGCALLSIILLQHPSTTKPQAITYMARTENKRMVETQRDKKTTGREWMENSKAQMGHFLNTITSSSSAFPSYISGVHHFLGEIFAYVTVFLIQPF